MTKSEKVFKNMEPEHLRILIIIFSRPKVLDALKIFFTMGPAGHDHFYKSAMNRMDELEMSWRAIRGPNPLLGKPEDCNNAPS